MNVNIKRNINRKNLICRDLSRSPHNLTLQQTYKKHNNVLLNQIRYAKKLYYAIFLEINKSNSKTEWKLIKELTSDKQTNTNHVVLKSNNDVN